ncbi:multidrug resistance-associated protein 1, 3 (mrp1, 3), abc-transoprter, putative, partial [Ricinus communis]
RYNFASTKELMRINGTSKSSVASHIAESVAGAMTIRAFEQEDRSFQRTWNSLTKMQYSAQLFSHPQPLPWPCLSLVLLPLVRYRPNAPLVLQGISCTVEGGHKIGIVGRTGSGKTTIISTLFRLVEPTDGK